MIIIKGLALSGHNRIVSSAGEKCLFTPEKNKLHTVTCI